MTAPRDPLALVARVQELDKAATPGPWEYVHGYGWWSKAAGHVPSGLSRDDGPPTPDHRLIREYRTLAPQLAAEVERLRSLLGRVLREKGVTMQEFVDTLSAERAE